ncbi:MAG: hypothetical protein J0H40_17895 [Rhizobiales bacterium]|nr:hypothetical protein [Hyphomicrobiales bacterium]
MRTWSSTLSNLIVLVEEVITRPNSDAPFAGGNFATLSDEVHRADTRPADGPRTTHAAMVMITAIKAFRGGEREATSPWLSVIGAALPLLRGDAWLALRNERAASEETRR